MPQSHERPPRRRPMLFALVAAAVVLAVLAWMTCSGERDAPESARDEAPAAGTTTSDASQGRSRARARAAVEPETALPVVSAPEATATGPADADGWPVADIVVRHPDGRPAAGAVVYVHLAGDRCGGVLTHITRVRAGNDGRVRLAVPHAGRYDVGAFEGQGFSALLQDIELPASQPVVIDLPACTRLDVRAECTLPPNARASVAPADAERICAFPGRGESKYAEINTRGLPTHVDVPIGVPLRISVSGGIVADPPVLTAPGTVTLRADGRIDVPLDFVFVGPEPPDHVYTVQLTVDAPTAEQPGPHVIDYGTMPRQLPITRRLTLRSAPGPVDLRMSIRGQGPVITSVFAAPLPEGQAHRVEVPVVSWEASEGWLVRLTCAGSSKPATLRAVVGDYSVQIALGETRSYAPRDWVGAVGGGDGGSVFVAAPQRPTFGQLLELVLVPGAQVVAKMRRPAGLANEWPVTAELADGRPFVDGNAKVVTRTHLIRTPGVKIAGREVALDEFRVGTFPPGDHEFVFRFAGREAGRRTVRVVAGPPIEVEAPELAPPKR